MGSINNPLLSMLIQSTGNNIGDTGATSLSEALKSNTALTQLDLGCETKRNNTQTAFITVHTFLFSSIQQTITLETQAQHH